jgi:hyperosmotically inducible protein
MMRKLKLMGRFLLSLLILTIAGCAGSPKTESTGEYFDDAILSTKVRTSILGDSRLKIMQIDVETFKGVVLLSGFVDSSAAANRAVQIARTIRGVKSVNNALVVK